MNLVDASALIAGGTGQVGAYLLVSGPAREAPVPRSGPVSVAIAVEKMLIRVFARENADSNVEIRELVHGPGDRVRCGPSASTAATVWHGAAARPSNSNAEVGGGERG